MTTLLAVTRLMPSEPAFVEMRNNRPLKQRVNDGKGHLCDANIHTVAHTIVFVYLLMHLFQWAKCFIPGIIRFAKLLGPFLPQLRADGAIEAVVIHVFDPCAR